MAVKRPIPTLGVWAKPREAWQCLSGPSPETILSRLPSELTTQVEPSPRGPWLDHPHCLQVAEGSQRLGTGTVDHNKHVAMMIVGNWIKLPPCATQCIRALRALSVDKLFSSLNHK